MHVIHIPLNLIFINFEFVTIIQASQMASQFYLCFLPFLNYKKYWIGLGI